jgi:hypothetical protein
MKSIPTVQSIVDRIVALEKAVFPKQKINTEKKKGKT